MKILLIAHTIRGGGAETYLRGLLPDLVSVMDDSSFKLIVPLSKAHCYEHISNRLSLQCVPDSLLDCVRKRLIFDNVTLFKIALDFRPDLIFVASEIICPRLKKLKKPIVLVYHSTLQFYMPPDFINSRLKLWYTRFMRDKSAKIASMIISVSHFERAEVGMRYHRNRYEKSAVVYHGVNHNIFFPKGKNEVLETVFDFPYIVCISDYHEHKKMDEMIQIYRLMVEYGVKEHLVIIGRVKNKFVFEKINKEIERYGLNNNIHMVEYVDNGDLRCFYVNASLYWTHSNAESFGLTPLEAMACKLPVFAPWREALPEVYGNNVCFYNTFTDSNEEIARRGADLLMSTEKRIKYAELGYKLSLNFSWNRAAIEYKKIFERLEQ